ncbi:hypothetical protein PEPS_17680 [Persicobacter psychrovividus]|uniref:Uncharacterized protein n=1 Tax=Persicobacter psychrovividus TaxID=387638 RepID=A0ABN6LCU8_9BACT|nr:hypothetical protein PEPS_17680 [Persicobacter psychrovividus]
MHLNLFMKTGLRKNPKTSFFLAAPYPFKKNPPNFM